MSRCSTKVDSRGKHIGGSDEWGYCDKNCRLKEDISTSTTSTTTTATTTTPTTTAEVAQKLTGSVTESGTYLPEAETYSCGLRLASGFILGGEDTKRGDYPFVAVLGYDRPSGLRPFIAKCSYYKKGSKTDKYGTNSSKITASTWVPYPDKKNSNDPSSQIQNQSFFTHHI